MKHFQKLSMMLIGGLLLTGAAINANADEWNKKTYITISQSIEVPGAILPPGRYVFKLLDSQSNRHIVQVLNDRENHVYCTNLAIPKERMEPADKTILTFYEMPGGGPEPVRAWFYPGDLIGQEFVYPKHRMTEILAAMNKGRITVAQNTQTNTNNNTEMAAVTPVPEQQNTEQNMEQQQTEQKAEETPAPAPTPSPAPVEEQAPASAPEQPAPAPAMPHTSSNTIEIGLLGLMCLGLAISFRIANRIGSGS
jgi:hypothetical protein